MTQLSLILKEFEQKYNYSLKVLGRPSQDPHLDHVIGDSREVLPNSVFCCIKGEKSDGLDYASGAIGKGASVLLTDRESPLPVIQLFTDHVRRDMGRLASIVYGDPSSKMKMFAVTGTNGKSTTSWMIRHILREFGVKTGLFGTIVYDDGNHERDAERTTPESWEIQRALASMVQNGCGACVMEASSHGLSMERLEGCAFDGAVFTNLSEEHLDYHKSMDDYMGVKSSLFSRYMKSNWRGAANRDDLRGRGLLAKYPESLISFGIDKDDAKGLKGRLLSATPFGSRFSVLFAEEGTEMFIDLPLPGRFNVYNALGSLALMTPFSKDTERIAAALCTMPQVPGRMERYMLSNGVFVIIDFAHTPLALTNVLSELKAMTGGSLFAVFGHGGERFQPNRLSLGLAAGRYCDRVIITMDNPRGEDPQKIAAEIYEGIKGSSHRPPTDIILDRRAAVRKALDEAQKGDVVAVTGKGPEKHIVIGGRNIPYSDRETVLEWAQERGLTVQ